MKIDDQIIPYLTENAREALGIESFDIATIEKLPGGDYNYNYHVSAEGHELLVRLNIEPQSGLDTQIEYEYATLEFLAPQGVTPKPLFLDNSRNNLKYGLLIEEFIPGGHLQFSVESMRRVARSMAALHRAPIAGATLRCRNNPLKEQVDEVNNDLQSYRNRQNPDQDLIGLGEKVVYRLRQELTQHEGLYKPTSVIHTDPNPANIIDNGEQVYFIDWEQGRIDDPSYDVAAFFSDVLNLWASPRVLTDKEKKVFLEEYVAKTGDASIEKRLGPRLLAYTLNAVIWGSNRIADVDEGKIDAHLGAQNYGRYKAISDLSYLEALL